MDSDLSKPQRESAFGIIIMAAHTLFKVVKALFFIIVYAFIKISALHSGYFFMAAGIILLLCLVYACLWYLKFTFYLDAEKQEFVVNKGILNRDQLVIHVDKIQQVDINQNVLQKIIGVYGLKIDTAGAKGQEVNIRAINEALAYKLKAHLLSGKQIPAESPAAIADPVVVADQPFLRISNQTLFKVGLTSNYGRSLLLIVAAFFYVIQEARHIITVFKIDSDHVKNIFLGFATLFSVAIIVVVLLVAFLLFNLARTFYKYYELEIVKHQESLLLSTGLLARKNTLINPDKVQITKYSQNYFQKKLNMLNMSLRQANFGVVKEGHEIQGNTLDIVGCNATERDEILKMILGRMPLKGKTFIPNWRFLNLPVFFKLILPVAVFLTVALNIPEVKPYIGLAGVYLVVGMFMIYISYRRHKLAVNQDFIIKMSGIWDVSNEIIMPHKIQSITTSQYPWHKSIDVGHLCLHTAAGQIHFKYGNYTEIKQLVNYWLYQVESGDKDWM